MKECRGAKTCLQVLLLLLLVLARSAAAGQTDPVLRAGDVIGLSVPGEEVLTKDFQVDREGKVNLPEVGAIEIAGLTVKEAERKLHDRLSFAFRDLERLQLRLREQRLPITVLGNVKQPGLLELPGTATVQVALGAAGGLDAGADLERMQLRRGDRVITFDYQKYLDLGDLTILPKLQPLDTLFVPAARNLLQIIGAVRAPGTYSWSEDGSLLDLIARAGGPSERADIWHIKILTPQGGKATSVSFDLATFLILGGDLDTIPALKPGSTVLVPELTPKAEWLRQPSDRSIYIMGAVGEPGRYGFQSGFTFLDILTAAGGPTKDADLEKVRVTRRASNGPEVTKLNFFLFLESGDTSLLPQVQPGDIIYVPNRDRNWLEQSKETTVRVLGAVNAPGRYSFDDNMTILDLLAEAGGPTNDAYQEKIVVVNLSCCKDQARVFNLVGFARSGDFTQLPVVRPGDTVYVPTTANAPWTIFMKSISDTLQILSLVVVAGAL
jgi:protein involved in polysaccharide export with SLBB domain